MLAEQPGLQNAGYCAGANSSSKVANVQPGVEDLQKCLTLTFLWSVIAVNNLGISRVFKHQGLQHGISLSPALVITPKDSESGELNGVFCFVFFFTVFTFLSRNIFTSPWLSCKTAVFIGASLRNITDLG